MIDFGYILFIFSLAIAGNYGSNIEYDGWLNIRLQHSFGTNGDFSDRGNISIQSLRSGGAILNQAPLAPTHIKLLETLSKSDDFYQLRSIATLSDGSESIFLSSIKADTLLETDLHDCITVWLLPSGGVASVGISPTNLIPGEEPFNAAAHSKFTTEVYVKHMEQAPVPDTASYIQKLEREREARDKGEFKDNRSFFAKYWMYIVPVVIFVLLSGAANPEQAAAAR